MHIVLISFHVSKRAASKMVSSCTTLIKIQKGDATAEKIEQNITKKEVL